MSDPLSAIGTILGGGRYNALGAFEVHYLAPTTNVVLHETNSTGPTRIAPLTLFTVDVVLSHVVDLSDPDVIAILGVSAGELVIDWRAEMLDGTTPITHDIGAAAYAAGIEALAYPSAQVPGEKNLAVIAEMLREGSSIRINPADDFSPGARVEIVGRRRP